MRGDWDFDDDEDDYEPPPFPVTVRVAAVIWIVLAGFFILGSCVSYWVLPVVLQLQRGNGMQPRPGEGCVFFLGILVGVGFLLAGILNVRGTARDTLWGSILSLVVGVLYLCSGVLAVVALPNAMILGILPALLGFVSLLPGVLGLVGRTPYRQWRQATDLLRRQRRRRYEDEEEDEDDRRRGRYEDEDEDDERRRPPPTSKRAKSDPGIRVDCPRCFKTVTVATAHGGQTVPCPNCQNLIDVPAP